MQFLVIALEKSIPELFQNTPALDKAVHSIIQTSDPLHYVGLNPPTWYFSNLVKATETSQLDL